MTSKRKELIHGLVVAGLLIGSALAIVAARRLHLLGGPDLAPRLFGLVCGLVLAAYGNVIPRRLVRYEPDSGRPARRQAALRFAGWAFVLAGLTNAAIWAFAPTTDMALWSMAPIAAAVVLVALRCRRAPLERSEA